jgi:hypothetical protein
VHSDEHAEPSATTLLNLPTLQFVHSADPPSEYCPAPHTSPADVIDADAHAEPGNAVQFRHVAAPAAEKVPARHITAVALIDPCDGHA